MMEENGDLLMCKGMFREIHPYVNVVANEGPSPGVLVGWKNGRKGSTWLRWGLFHNYFCVRKVIASLMRMKRPISIQLLLGVSLRIMWCTLYGFKTKGGLIWMEFLCWWKEWHLENVLVLENFGWGYSDIRNLPFQLLNENQLRCIMKDGGKVMKIEWESWKLVDFLKGKLWVEMHLNLVL